jgi:hypothetical protein
MKKARKARMEPAASSRTTSQRGTSKRASVTQPGATDSVGARRNRDDWVQLSFRAPAAFEEFIMMLCVKRRITFQTLILELLWGLGAPISDADLQGNRKRRKASQPVAALLWIDYG